ncbi:DUF4190 domain-containing protein [Streptomyces sporangiiformans]|uniref:DUF4190 domain-containing protein n=1 Tax=Streptomyces sporangiiformans TaxID=2315329 RepID=A0A505DHX5_9ACTN|nr:DUF4190 domain-containing protein [Streptomyces sporangiiformans]TPQ21415.1 DUF4190 domain-containing protein [Streptomyces sporangiiformans]
MDTPPPPGPQQPQGGPYPPQGPYGAYPGQGQGQGQGPYGQGQGQNPYGQGQGPGPYGYQPWGQGYSPYNRPTPVNGFAIAALVLGILCFLPLFGLVLGWVALAQIKKKGERGKGMAVAGMILSGIGAALLVLGLVTGAAADFWDGFKEGARDARENGAAFTVDKGECFDTTDGSLEGMAYDVDTVPCEGKHDGEVFANFKMAAGSYPGDDAVTRAADDKCYTLQYAYAMDSWALPDNVDIYYFTPTRESWSLGDREISCLFGNTDEKGSLTGSLRRDETTLDADQLVYLKAANVLNEAMESAPEEEYVEDDLPGHKQWATRVSGALTEQAGMLRDHDWSADAREPVAELVQKIEASQKEWAKAAKASDADVYYEHYDKGAGLIDPKVTVTAREALGLATDPPASSEDGGDGGGGSGGGGAEV